MPAVPGRLSLGCAVPMERDLSRSRAILVSNGEYSDPEIPDLPAMAGCIPAMKSLLTSDLCDWPPDRVTSLPEVALRDKLARNLVELVKDAEDVLLVYYAGHGLRTATGQLALALGDSSADRKLLPYTAMLYKDIAEILRDCPAATKLVILDCCHAELGNRDNFQTQSDDIDAEPVDGLYFIGASKKWEKARSPLDGGLPYFTDAFIKVVRTGIPGKPPQLTIDQIFTELRLQMMRANLPEPMQSGIRDAHHWPFARNAAPPATHRDLAQEVARLTRRVAEYEGLLAESEGLLAESEGLKAAAYAQALALQAEVENLRRQASRADTAEEKQDFRDAIDTAERLLEDTVAEVAATTEFGPPGPTSALDSSGIEATAAATGILPRDPATALGVLQAESPRERPPLINRALASGAGGKQLPARRRSLAGDLPMWFWWLRAGLAAAVGSGAGVLTSSWVVGLTLAFLAGIIDIIYRSTYGIWIAVNGGSAAVVRKRTKKQLHWMQRDGYLTLHQRPIPNSREFIDHLVVGPTGVYAIDSEQWDARVPVRTLNGKRLYRGPESQAERLEHAVWEAGQASEILSAALGTEITVRAALAIYGPRIPWDIATIRSVDVFSGPALRKYLKQRARQRNAGPKLTREEVRTIHETAARMLPDGSPRRAVTPVG